MEFVFNTIGIILSTKSTGFGAPDHKVIGILFFWWYPLNMTESGAGEPKGLFDKVKGIFKPKVDKEAEKILAEFERSFNEALTAHNYDALYRVVINAHQSVGSARAMEMVRSVTDLMVTDTKDSDPRISGNPVLFCRVIDFLIFTAGIKTGDKSALEELVDREKSVLSKILFHPETGVRALYADKLRDEVKKGKEKILGEEGRVIASAGSTSNTARVNSLLQGGLEVLVNYQKERLIEIEKSFNSCEAQGHIYGMHCAFRNYISWTDESDSPQLRNMVSRAAKVLENNTKGQFPKGKDYSLQNVIEGATGFLLAGVEFNYHRSVSEFQSFYAISDGFSHLLRSPYRADILRGLGLEGVINTSKEKIGQALGEIKKKAMDREGFNQEMIKKLLRHIEDLRFAEGLPIEDQKTVRRKEVLKTAMANKDLLGVFQVANGVKESGREMDKAVAVEAVESGICLLEEIATGSGDLLRFRGINSLIQIGNEFLKMTSGYFDSNNIELGKKWGRVLSAFNCLVRRAIREKTPLSLELQSTINEGLLALTQLAQVGLNRGNSDMALRCNRGIQVLESFQRQLSASPPTTPEVDIWTQRPPDILRADQRGKLTMKAAVVSAEVSSSKVGILPERRIRDILEMSDGSIFKILKIKSGGQFVVYQVEDEKGNEVCLRTERKDLMKEDKIQPGQITASIGIIQELIKGAPPAIGERIITPYGIYFDKEGNWYFKSMWYEGTSLQEVMDQRTVMGEDEVEQIIRKLVEVLIYFSDKKVSHRDIKPANILVKPDGEMVLIDFDIAIKLDEKTGKAVNSDNFGTGTYAGKEQFGSDAKTMITITTDCHALGAMIYEMLTREGQTLNAAGNPLLLEDRVGIRFPKIRTLPKKWQDIIENCTFHNPDSRWTAMRVLQRLEEKEPFTI